MSTIPKAVLEKIEEYVQRQKHLVSSEGLENIRTDVMYGYSLASKTIDDLQEINDALLKSKIKCNDKIMEQASTIAEQQKRIEELEKRDGVVLLTQSSSEQSKQIEELKAENESIMGIMKVVFYATLPNKTEENILIEWNKFLERNNL